MASLSSTKGKSAKATIAQSPSGEKMTPPISVGSLESMASLGSQHAKSPPSESKSVAAALARRLSGFLRPRGRRGRRQTWAEPPSPAAGSETGSGGANATAGSGSRDAGASEKLRAKYLKAVVQGYQRSVRRQQAKAEPPHLPYEQLLKGFAQTSADGESLIDRYDVFSPDVRDTRWRELLDQVRKDRAEDFETYLKSVQGSATASPETDARPRRKPRGFSVPDIALKRFLSRGGRTASTEMQQLAEDQQHKET